MEQTCALQCWKLSCFCCGPDLAGDIHLRSGTGRGMKGVVCSEEEQLQGKKMQGDGKSSSLSNSTKCNVGFRAAVLLKQCLCSAR